MAAHKSHHFVPQFLLRKFASDAGGRHLCLYRVKERKHIQQVSIRDQCARDHYYGKNSGAEKALADFEGLAAGVIKTITIDGRVPEPNTQEIFIFYVFAMLQRSRTPAEVARQEEMATQFRRHFAKSDPTRPEELRPHIDRLRATYPDGRTPAMEFALKYSPMLTDLRLKVLRSAGNAEFAIGDAPVVLHNQWCRRVRGPGSIGLACHGLQVFLPLSPNHLAIAYDTDVYRVGESAPDFVDVSDDEVLAFNSLQFAGAHSSVYYRSPRLAAHLDLIPTSAREDSFGIDMGRFKEEGAQHSYLFSLSHHSMNVDLKSGAVRVRDDSVRVPLRERIRKYRPEAMATARWIDPKNFASEKERMKPRGTGVFRRVD